MADVSDTIGGIDAALQSVPAPASSNDNSQSVAPSVQPTIDAISSALASPPKAAPAVVNAPSPYDHEITVHPTRPQIPASSVPADVAKSFGAGVETGTAATAGLPGDVSRLLDYGPAWLIAKGAEKLGLLPQGKTANDLLADAKKLDMTDDSWHLPTSGDMIKATEAVAGPIYQPQSVPGDYAKTIGEFVPAGFRAPVTAVALPAIASETAGQVTKGTGFEPYARIGGAIAGGAAGLAGVGAGEAANLAKGALQDYRRPASVEGQQQTAGQRLADAASDPAAVRQALAAPNQEIVPGSAPTTFQVTGDLGLGQAERQARTANPEPFIARDADQNAARVGAVQGVQSTGNPADVAAQFRQIRENLDQQTQGQVDALTPAAQAANAAIGGHGTAEATGYALRQPMADARAAAKENENKLWSLVNQDGGVPATGIAQAAQDITKSVSPSAAPLAGEEARILGVAGGYPAVQRFGDLKDLRSSISDAVAEAKRAGNTQTVRRLTMLKGAVDDALDHGVENQAALEQIAVNRGLMNPADTIDARVKSLVSNYFERQQQARVAAGAGRSYGAGTDRPTASAGLRGAGVKGSQGQRDTGSGERVASQAGERSDQSQVGGSLSYQAPSFGDRSVSARMHAPETSASLGQDVPGTSVRTFGGPLDGRQSAGVVAYHGTPHDFDRFSSEHIGNGEGAQAYGHGLYFAENPGIAKGYRDTLSNRDATFRLGPVDQPGAQTGINRDDFAFQEGKDAVDHLIDEKGDLTKAIVDTEGALKKARAAGDEAGVKNWTERLRIFRDFEEQGFQWGGSRGHLYQVRVNRDPEHFLQWDKPIAEQSPFVQAAMQKALGVPDRIETLPNGNYVLMSGQTAIGREWPLLGGAREALKIEQAKLGRQTGAQAYESSRLVPGNIRQPVAASKALSANGIAGIRYLDNGSRGIGEGTSNYVTFNDHDILVTHKNGAPLVRPVSLPDYLRGEAASSFGSELKAAGIKGKDFSGDLTQRAMKLIGDGRFLDHSRAFESAFGDRYAALRGSLSAEGGGDAQASRAASGSAQGVPGDGFGRGSSGEAGGASSQNLRFHPEDVANYRAATSATRDRAQTFDEGTSGQVLKPAGRGGYAMPDAAVPAAVIQDGKATAAQSVQQFLAAGGTPDALADATAFTIRKNAMLPDGTLDPGKVHAWLRRNADAVAQMPPEVAAKFKTAADAQDAVNQMVTARKDAMNAFDKTAVAKIAGLQDSEDVVRHVGSILSRGDAVNQMRTLATAASKDPAAKEGLRRALAEHMTQKLLSNTEAGTSGVQQIKADAYLTYLKQNAAALRQVFSPQELDIFNAVGRDLQRSNRAVAATKGNKGSPGTAQDLIKAPEGSSILTKLIFENVPKAGWTVTAAKWLGTNVIARGRAAGLANVDNLVSEALLNPSLARALLAKVPPKADTGTGQSLGSKFAAIASKAAIGTAASVTGSN